MLASLGISTLTNIGDVLDHNRVIRLLTRLVQDVVRFNHVVHNVALRNLRLEIQSALVLIGLGLNESYFFGTKLLGSREILAVVVA